MQPNVNNLLDFLSNYNVTFFIPPYQRNYEWTEDQCDIFFKDIKKTYESNNNGKYTEHFIGTITYYAEKEYILGRSSQYILIDGQQRITTAMLFMIAVRDVIDDQKLKEYIKDNYLCNPKAEGDDEYKIKLKQIEKDWKSYKSLIFDSDSNEVVKDSCIYKNYRFFYDNLKELQKQGIDIVKLIDYGLRHFSIVSLQLEPRDKKWENPQEIFESMNSLGKPLSLADLVRNYLMLGLSSKEQNEYYKRYWLKIENLLPGEISNFIRDYMQAYEMKSYMKATEANYKKLYYEFKTLFEKSTIDTKSLLEDLCFKANIYSSIISDRTIDNANIDALLADFRYVKFSVAYSLILELLTKWKKGEFNNSDIIGILEALRIYCLRRRLLGLTSAENKNMPALARQIPEIEKSDDKKDAMFSLLSSLENSCRLPNDIEIQNALEETNFYNFGYCKFYLSLIEEALTKSRPNLNDKLLQVEHIMPQSLNDKWRVELGDNAEEIHTEYVNNIGNLTLIRHNQELGQKDFSYKREIYQDKAGLQIAKTNITNCQKWNKDSIINRSNWLIRVLLDDVLPIPYSMRKSNNFSTKESSRFSFEHIGLIGKEVHFADDYDITAKVVNDREVLFEGKRWKLSPLTREIYTRKGTVNNSGAYQGPLFWTYNGVRLTDIEKY